VVLEKDGEDELDRNEMRNEEVLLRVNEQRNILHEIHENGRLTGLVTSYIETAF
jgi:hypothetical protein